MILCIPNEYHLIYTQKRPPHILLLMVQKYGVHQLRLIVYPCIYRVLGYIPGGCSQDFWTINRIIFHPRNIIIPTNDAHHFGQVGSKLTSLQHSLEGRTPLITKHVCRYPQNGGVSWTLLYCYFWGVGKLPYISRTAAAYIGEDLHFGYLKCLVI